MKMYEIELSKEELLLLDGKVSEKTQAFINEVKRISSYDFSHQFMDEVLKEAEESGKLPWKHVPIRSCRYCDKTYDYYRYPRSGKYHNKGDKNFNKPIYHQGVLFNPGFVRIEGHGHICLDCCRKHNIKEQLIDCIIENDFKIEIQQNEYKPSKYLIDEMYFCKDCGAEFGKSKAVTKSSWGGEYVPAECPCCKSKKNLNAMFDRGENRKYILNPINTAIANGLKDIIKAVNEDTDEFDLELKCSKGDVWRYFVMDNLFEKRQFPNGKSPNVYAYAVKFNQKTKQFTTNYHWKASPYKEKIEEYFIAQGYEEYQFC